MVFEHPSHQMCKMASKMNIHGPACSRNEQGATVMFGFPIRLNRFRFEGFGHALCVGEAKAEGTPNPVAFKATTSP